MSGYLAGVGARLGIVAAVAVALAAAVFLIRRKPAADRKPRPESPAQRTRRAHATSRLGLTAGGWILFTSTTCAPCKKVRADLESAGVAWAEVDVDEHPELFRLWNVYRVPTLIWADAGGSTRERHGPASARGAIATADA